MESQQGAGLGLESLQEIVAGTAGDVGAPFFDSLVRHLARASGCKCAWVTEWLPEGRRLRALSFWVGDGYFGDFEYPIEGTPCEPVIERRELVAVPDRVVELFRTDASLRPLGAVSYLGVPLLDLDGAILGHLAVLDDKPLSEEDRATRAVFSIFAERAAAELRRLRRERALREREQKLSRMLASALDAIVELDRGLRVARMNPAAARVFRLPADAEERGDFGRFLAPEARGRLAYLIADLERQPAGRQSAWIPDGLEAIRADGSRFPAEATLSRFEMDGRAHFTLILRDVDERLAAEERMQALLRESDYLRREVEARGGFEEILGASPALLRALADLERVAASEASVLITGETGTGKELFARAIHRRSRRARGPLIAVNCAAIPANLQESEFFGHERGAFTGATQQRHGRFQLADGGTIFLDEVGEMSLDLQAKLLRVLQEGEFHPVGAARGVRADVRVVAATNRDLGAMAARGAFREDLLYRLNVFPIRVPPLRERGADVVLLAESFLRAMQARRGLPPAPLAPADRVRLRRYAWPGNVRELQNVMERALILGSPAGRPDLAAALPQAGEGGAAEAEGDGAPGGAERILTDHELRRLERENLERALRASGGKLSGEDGAARRLGIHPNTLASRMKALGIESARRSRKRGKS